MPSQRCSTCGLNWPAAIMYNKCPACEEATDYIQGQPSMGTNEANERLRHIKADLQAAAARQKEKDVCHELFEEWYAERELKKFRSEMDAYEFPR